MGDPVFMGDPAGLSTAQAFVKHLIFSRLPEFARRREQLPTRTLTSAAC